MTTSMKSEIRNKIRNIDIDTAKRYAPPKSECESVYRELGLPIPSDFAERCNYIESLGFPRVTIKQVLHMVGYRVWKHGPLVHDWKPTGNIVMSVSRSTRRVFDSIEYRSPMTHMYSWGLAQRYFSSPPTTLKAPIPEGIALRMAEVREACDGLEGFAFVAWGPRKAFHSARTIDPAITIMGGTKSDGYAMFLLGVWGDDYWDRAGGDA